MNKVCNIARKAARDWSVPLEKDQYIWICISEPNSQVISNKFLDLLPRLNMNFYDLDHKAYDLESKSMIYPPSSEDAKAVVDFILLHKDKNVIVNCAAGVSRSGAIAQFCEDLLNYEWCSYRKSVASPNRTLYRLLVNYYVSTLSENSLA